MSLQHLLVKCYLHRGLFLSRKACCGLLVGLGSATYSVLAPHVKPHRTSKQINRDQPPAWRIAQENHAPPALLRADMKRIAESSGSSEHFRRLLHPLLIPRAPGSPGSAAVRAYLLRKLTKLGYAVELDSFVGHPPAPYLPTTFTNVIATSDPEASRKLVLACHYDSKIIDGIEFIGATDSAVSCALMLDIAGLLHNVMQERKSKDISLQLIFFDGEEAFVEWTESDSCYGSRHLARKLSGQPHRQSPDLNGLSGMDLFILLDLIGASDVQFHDFVPKSSRWFHRLSEIERELLVLKLLKASRTSPYFSTNQLSEQFKIGDDHQAFEERGVLVMHLISYPFPRVWHTSSDDVDHLDFDSISDINDILRAFVCEYLNCRLPVAKHEN